MYTRISKLVLVLAFALYASLVAFNNLTDYNSNFTLVAHVLTMDTTFPGNQGLWRAIHSPVMHHTVYGLIISIEIAIAALCWLGGLRLYRSIQNPTAFNHAKGLVILGLTLGFLLWFTGFMTMGGEWFLMWQSETANGQQAAFRLVMIIAAILIYLGQAEEQQI
jgi:predicted small integral membrane protein